MKPRIATAWLEGCSGCHMSLLDMDQRLIDLLERVDLVYSPLVDAKEFPENVDITLVEGAVGTQDDLDRIRRIRERTRVLISLGDCAVTANVPGMRNPFGAAKALNRAYIENASFQAQVPNEVIPALLPRVRPVHEFVQVDYFIPGCPPPADAIHFVLSEFLEGRTPDLNGKTRFGR